VERTQPLEREDAKKLFNFIKEKEGYVNGDLDEEAKSQITIYD
jgi:hypothetical protein